MTHVLQTQKRSRYRRFVLTTIATDGYDEAVEFMSEYSEQYPMEDEPAKLVFFHDTDSDTAPKYTIVE